MRWNKMYRVICPRTGAVEWANGMKVGEKAPLDKVRCTACGDTFGHKEVGK